MATMANQTTNRRWQDWVTLVLGIWLFISPWALGFYAGMTAASWNFFIVGVAFVVFAVAALNLRTLWEEWVNLVLGIWMIVSPWVLRFNGTSVARDDAIIVGLIAAAISIWAIAERQLPSRETDMDRSLGR
jgi:hypothetical protein